MRFGSRRTFFSVDNRPVLPQVGPFEESGKQYISSLDDISYGANFTAGTSRANPDIYNTVTLTGLFNTISSTDGRIFLWCNTIVVPASRTFRANGSSGFQVSNPGQDGTDGGDGTSGAGGGAGHDSIAYDGGEGGDTTKAPTNGGGPGAGLRGNSFGGAWFGDGYTYPDCGSSGAGADGDLGSGGANGTGVAGFAAGGGGGGNGEDYSGAGGGGGGGLVVIVCNEIDTTLGNCSFQARGGNGGSVLSFKSPIIEDAGGGGGGGGGAVLIYAKKYAGTCTRNVLGGNGGQGLNIGDGGAAGDSKIFEIHSDLSVTERTFASSWDNL